MTKYRVYCGSKKEDEWTFGLMHRVVTGKSILFALKVRCDVGVPRPTVVVDEVKIGKYTMDELYDVIVDNTVIFVEVFVE